MAGARKSSSGKRSKRSVRKTSTKRAPTTKKAAVALIKQVVARTEETKFRSEIILNKITFNSQISGDGDIIRLLPKLVQDQGNGTAYERHGMNITPRSLMIHADVCLTDVDRSGAIVVCYWVLTHKNQKQTSNLNTAGGVELGQLLRTGEASEVQNFNGRYQDSVLPVDKSHFTVLKHGKFMLGKNTGTVQDVTTAGNQPMYGNHIRKAVNFRLKTPATLTYKQDGGSPRTTFYPDGYAPFMVFGYYHQNQTVPDVNNQDITVTLRSSLYYDDA